MEDPQIVRKLMIGTITDSDLLRGLRDVWCPELVGSAWLWLASTSFKFLDQFGTAPGRNIEALWAKANLEPETKNELGRLFRSLSEQWENETDRPTTDFLLSEARCYFSQELYKRKVLEIEAAVEAGKLDRADEIRRELNEGIEKIATASVKLLKLITAKELQEMDIPEPQWVVRGIIPTGLTLLAGKPKSGKSYLMINLAAQLAVGGKVFGVVETEPTEILYLGLEDPVSRIKQRMEEVLGPDKLWPDNLHFASSGQWPKLHKGGKERLQQWMQEHPDTKLVIIDTLQKVRRPSKAKGNVYTEDYQAMEPFQGLASKHNIGVIVVHHTKKGKEQEVFDEISGSTGLTGATDTNIVFRKVPGPEQNTRHLHYQGREMGQGMLELAFENHRFRLDKVPETEGHIKWVSPQRELILYLLETLGLQTEDPPHCQVSRTDLIAALGENVGSGVDVILSSMVENGEILRPRRGFYLHPDHAIRLRAIELGEKIQKKREAQREVEAKEDRMP